MIEEKDRSRMDLVSARTDEATDPITVPPSWRHPYAGEKQQDICDMARAVTRAMCANPSGIGFAMRGFSLGIADSYEDRQLALGLANTLQGVRNAFAQVYQDRGLAQP